METSIITSEELTEVMKKLKYQPKSKYINAIVEATNEYFSDKNTAAMFLAQCAHESTGYADIEEKQYKGASKSPYGKGIPGKSYHGRGFIQLSWPENYRAASEGIGKRDELYYNPEKVANDPKLGARVSVWYWKNVVEKEEGFNPFENFGVTTKAINGKLECNGQNEEKSKNRYTCYVEMCKAMGIKPADERGCYN